MEGSGRGLIVYYPSFCLEGLKKTMKSRCQDKRYPGRNSNWEPPEYVRSVDKVNLMHLTLGIAELVLSFTLQLPYPCGKR
jgi:hypothetical protein